MQLIYITSPCASYCSLTSLFVSLVSHTAILHRSTAFPAQNACLSVAHDAWRQSGSHGRRWSVKQLRQQQFSNVLLLPRQSTTRTSSNRHSAASAQTRGPSQRLSPSARPSSTTSSQGSTTSPAMLHTILASNSSARSSTSHRSTPTARSYRSYSCRVLVCWRAPTSVLTMASCSSRTTLLILCIST